MGTKVNSKRKRTEGNAERPRLCVFRSARHVYAQVINDDASSTLVAASTIEPSLEKLLQGLSKKDQAKAVGKEVAKRCREKGIEKVVFDRNGFIYHGRVSSLADGAREGGLQF